MQIQTEERAANRAIGRNDLRIPLSRMYGNLLYICAPHSIMCCNLQCILDGEIRKSFLLTSLFSARRMQIETEERAANRAIGRNDLRIPRSRMHCNLQYICAPHSIMHCNLQYILDGKIRKSFLPTSLFSVRRLQI